MKAGRILLFLLLATGGVGTLVNGAVYYVRLLYLGVLLLMAAWLLTVTSLRGVKVERRARTARAAVGDIFEEHFEIVNTSRVPKLWLEVINEAKIPNAAGSRIITFLRGRQRRSYIARTWLTSRGGFTLGPTTLASGDPFGIFRTSKKIPAEARLVVFPMIYPVRTFLSPPGLLPGGKAIRRKAVDLTPHAAGVREYVPGDPLKRIHWASTARRGRLMVKEFEQDPQAEVWFFLDTHKSVHVAKALETSGEAPLLDGVFFLRRQKIQLPPSTLEYAISVTASLAHYFIEQRRSVGLVTASAHALEVIPAERSERQEAKLLEALAFLQGESALTLPSLISAQSGQMPPGSSAILVTPMTRHELLPAVENLQRRNLRPLVILLMAHSFGAPQNNEDLARLLAERNVPLCPVYCGTDLAETLSTFSTNIFSQEFAWRQPVLSHLT